MASRRGTGGVEDCGGFEEDHQVTWETLDLPWEERAGAPRPTPTRRAPEGARLADAEQAPS
jgi:hypothetical protein